MGYAGKLDQKFQAQNLRREGLSYGEIRKHIIVSKDSLSRWCKDIELTEDQKLRLIRNKFLGQKKGSVIAADNKRKDRIFRTEKIKKESIKQIGTLLQRDKFIAGVALYAGEGDKTDRRIGFSNADPKLIKFMMEWLITYAEVPPVRIRGALYIHAELDEDIAKQYWATLTGIPKSQFIKTYIVKKNGKSKFRKNIHRYGVFSIRCSDSAIHRKIMGWIYAIFDVKINQLSPVAQW